MSTLVRIQPLPLEGKARLRRVFLWSHIGALRVREAQGDAGERRKTPRKTPRAPPPGTGAASTVHPSSVSEAALGSAARDDRAPTQRALLNTSHPGSDQPASRWGHSSAHVPRGAKFEGVSTNGACGALFVKGRLEPRAAGLDCAELIPGGRRRAKPRGDAPGRWVPYRSRLPNRDG